MLYDALDVPSMTRPSAPEPGGGSPSARRCSAWSAPRTDPGLPAVGGLSLPGLPTLRLPASGPLPRARRTGRLVVDLRSGSYAALAPVPGAVTVQVLSERPDGTRTVVSHFNKAHKGRLARLLATTTAEPDGVVRLRRLLRRAGLHVEHDGGRPRPWWCLRPDRPRDVNSAGWLRPTGPGVT